VRADKLEIELLKPDAEEKQCLVPDHDCPNTEWIPSSALIQTLDVDYSQRQMKENNPHSEHAEDVFVLVQGELSLPHGHRLRGMMTRTSSS